MESIRQHAAEYARAWNEGAEERFSRGVEDAFGVDGDSFVAGAVWLASQLTADCTLSITRRLNGVPDRGERCHSDVVHLPASGLEVALDGAEGIAFWVTNCDTEESERVMLADIPALACFLRDTLPGAFATIQPNGGA